MLGNGFAAALVALLGVAAWRLRASPFWRERLREVARRRPIATAVVALYLGVALLDSVAWRDAQPGERAVETRSLLDRAFPADFRERSYSAPLLLQPPTLATWTHRSAAVMA